MPAQHEQADKDMADESKPEAQAPEESKDIVMRDAGASKSIGKH